MHRSAGVGDLDIKATGANGSKKDGWLLSEWESPPLVWPETFHLAGAQAATPTTRPGPSLAARSFPLKVPQAISGLGRDD